MTPAERQVDREIDAEKQPILLLKYGAFWFGILAILGALAMAAYEIVWEWSAERILARVVVFKPRDDRSINAIYEFTVEGRAYRGRIAPPKGSDRPKVQIGDAVSVLYQPMNPSSFVRDAVEARFWAPIVLCFALVPCLIGYGVFTAEIRRLETVRANRKSSFGD